MNKKLKKDIKLAEQWIRDNINSETEKTFEYANQHLYGNESLDMYSNEYDELDIFFHVPIDEADEDEIYVTLRKLYNNALNDFV